MFSQVWAIVIARCIDICVAGWIWRDYGVSISSHVGLELRKITPAIWAIVIGDWILNKIEKNHCELAIAADYARAVAAAGLLKPRTV